jgi:hypothetical protein
MGSHENKVYLSNMIKQAFENLKKFLLTPPVVKKGKPTLN